LNNKLQTIFSQHHLDCNPYNEKDLLRQQELLMKGLIDKAGKYRNAGVGVFSINMRPLRGQACAKFS
jgi:hypothetical protein